MAADRQPHSSSADADVDDDVTAQQQAKSAEDRKAAAALASLDGAGANSHGSSHGVSKHVDLEAVNKAMQNLQVGGRGGSGSHTAASDAANAASAAAKKAAEEKAAAIRRVKVDAADVALLVDQLELPKAKATDLLKHHEGSAVQAIRAFLAVH